MDKLPFKRVGKTVYRIKKRQMRVYKKYPSVKKAKRKFELMLEKWLLQESW